MAGESIAELLAELTGQTGESAVAIYGTWSGLSVANDDSLYRLVARKLTANAKGAQVRENLLSTIQAGGAVGESVEECLTKSGLLGWS